MVGTYVKIEIKGLPAIFPSWTFIDVIFNDERIFDDGYVSDIFKTDETWKTYSDTTSELSRLVQTISYKKYYSILYSTESSRIDLMRHAESVTITAADGTTYRVDVLDVSVEEIAGSSFKRYTIRFRDINPNNYVGETQPVNNFFECRTIQSRFGTSTHGITFLINSGKTLDAEWTAIVAATNHKFYTYITPKETIKSGEEKGGSSLGKAFVTNSSKMRCKRIKFYLTEDDKNVIEKYCPMFDGEIGKLRYYPDMFDPTIYFESLERVIPVIKQVTGAVNLFDCEIILPYSQLYKNHYE